MNKTHLGSFFPDRWVLLTHKFPAAEGFVKGQALVCNLEQERLKQYWIFGVDLSMPCHKLAHHWRPSLLSHFNPLCTGS